METQALQDLVHAVQDLHALAITLCVALGLLLCAVLYCGIAIVRALHALDPARGAAEHSLSALQATIEDAIERGESRRAIELSNDILAEYPMHVHATWYKAIAQFRAGAIHDASRSFKRVVELAPEWEHSVAPYLDVLADKVSAARPRPVRDDEH
jgi:hypothetical protein